MKLKNDCIEGEVYVVASDLLEAVKQVDKGNVYCDQDAAEGAGTWSDTVFRVEVKIYKA